MDSASSVGKDSCPNRRLSGSRPGASAAADFFLRKHSPRGRHPVPQRYEQQAGDESGGGEAVEENDGGVGAWEPSHEIARKGDAQDLSDPAPAPREAYVQNAGRFPRAGLGALAR